jgi:hypothetical protein
MKYLLLVIILSYPILGLKVGQEFAIKPISESVRPRDGSQGVFQLFRFMQKGGDLDIPIQGKYTESIIKNMENNMYNFLPQKTDEKVDITVPQQSTQQLLDNLSPYVTPVAPVMENIQVNQYNTDNLMNTEALNSHPAEESPKTEPTAGKPIENPTKDDPKVVTNTQPNQPVSSEPQPSQPSEAKPAEGKTEEKPNDGGLTKTTQTAEDKIHTLEVYNYIII